MPSSIRRTATDLLLRSSPAGIQYSAESWMPDFHSRSKIFNTDRIQLGRGARTIVSHPGFRNEGLPVERIRCTSLGREVLSLAFGNKFTFCCRPSGPLARREQRCVFGSWAALQMRPWSAVACLACYRLGLAKLAWPLCYDGLHTKNPRLAALKRRSRRDKTECPTYWQRNRST
jgi:hypothetical protein